MKRLPNAWSRGTTWSAVVVALVLAGALSACHPQAIYNEGVTKNQRELGEADYRLGRYAEARQHFLNSIAAKETGFRQHYWLGMTELKLGHPVAAQSAFEYAYSVRQEDPEWTPRILDGLAESLYQQDRLDALYAMLAEAATRYNSTEAYLRQADFMLRAGDPDNAVVAYRKAVRFADDDDPRPYIEIAEFYESINDVPNAIKSLRYAYYIAPDNQQVAEHFRRLGIVPGPTLRLEPPKPDLLTD